jgi:hypothetical protein
MEPKKPYHVEGFVDSAGAAKGMDVCNELFARCQQQG